jgi:hypothetical protein
MRHLDRFATTEERIQRVLHEAEVSLPGRRRCVADRDVDRDVVERDVDRDVALPRSEQIQVKTVLC